MRLLQTWFFVFFFSNIVALVEKEHSFLWDLFNATNSNNWLHKWNVTEINNNPCMLIGIACDTSNNHILSIHLSNNNIKGIFMFLL